MERLPEHLAEDPLLRQEYIGQLSFDEYLSAQWPSLLREGSDKFVAHVSEKWGLNLTLDQLLERIKIAWRNTLDPTTTMREIYYLEGMTTLLQRTQANEQWHASFVERTKDHPWAHERPQDVEFREKFGE
jgi:hypothetical protein